MSHRHRFQGPASLVLPGLHRLARRLVVLGGALAATALALPAVAQGNAGSGGSASAGAPNAAAPKVLRIAFGARENNFDPAQVSDVISAALVSSIFDSPLTYDQLARPVQLKLNTAAEMPEVNADFTHFVFRIRPNIFFSDHPAFKGRPRELTAADYVYSIKRVYDPATRSPILFHFEGAGLLGLSELRKKAIETKAPFSYDTEVPGLRVIDRYRFEVRLAKPAPRLLYVFASGSLTGALAREVVEAAAEKIGEQPVGTGPYVLAQWQRGTRIVLTKNPQHKHRTYDEQAPAGDAKLQAMAERLRGRPLPMLDRVEISIIEEAQPRWLAFLNGQIDTTAVPNEFVNLAVPNGKLAPNLARQGIQVGRQVAPTTWYTYFNMDHPVVGGYTPDKVALRRAVSLAYDVQREIDLVRRGQAVPAQSVLPPGVSGYDPAMKSEVSDHDVARAKALLDLYGYVDRDNDGWREQPDGSPLVLEYTSQPTQLARQEQSLWQKSLGRVGIRVSFKIGQWQENIKASRAGKLMMWGTGWSAAIPDGTYFLDVLYGPNKGQSNHSRFDLPEFNVLNERQRVMPDGPERDAVIAQAVRLSLAFLPLKTVSHPVDTFLSHGHVVNYRPHPYMRDWWRYVDIDPAATH
jgi:ABC-type transport system substrate-binding protein